LVFRYLDSSLTEYASSDFSLAMACEIAVMNFFNWGLWLAAQSLVVARPTLEVGIFCFARSSRLWYPAAWICVEAGGCETAASMLPAISALLTLVTEPSGTRCTSLGDRPSCLRASRVAT